MGADSIILERIKGHRKPDAEKCMLCTWNVAKTEGFGWANPRFPSILTESDGLQ